MDGLASKMVDGIPVNRCHYNLNLARQGKIAFVVQSWKPSVKGVFRWVTDRNAGSVILENVIPWYAPAGIQRILNGANREVVAGLQGRITDIDLDLVGSELFKPETRRQVRFNPKLRDCFFYQDNDAPFINAACVVLVNGRMFDAG